MRFRTGVLLATTILVGACSVPSESEFNKIRTMLKGDADLRREVNTVCIEDYGARPRAQRELGAKYMNVSLGFAPSTFCKRILAAITSGRLTYRDLEIIRDTKKPSPNLVRILKGG